jgi:ABC-type branched-subunit amino acid transport system substrate-binding protein
MWGNMRFKAIAALGILSLFASIVPAFGQATTKIGVITSLTGSLAAFGEAHKNGYAIAG